MVAELQRNEQGGSMMKQAPPELIVTTTALTSVATPAREKSALRKMSDRAAHPPGVKRAPDAVMGAFVDRLATWYCTELAKRRGL